MSERKPLSARTRFEVFKRDGFRCVYCGSTPNDGPLHVDHVDPVAVGGGNESDNLVTACATCNLGKSDVPLERRMPALDAEASLDHAQQIRAWAEAQQAVIAAKRDSRQAMVNLWCEAFGTQECIRNVPDRLLKLVAESSVAWVTDALGIAANNRGLRRDVDRLKYVYGIFRNWREDGMV